MNDGRLLLHPIDPAAQIPDMGALIGRLRELGLAGEGMDAAGRRFLAGDRFAELVAFLGCSPYLRFAPDGGGEAFCHLGLRGPFESPRLIFGRNTRPPRCPGCHNQIVEWRAGLGDETLHCHRCGGVFPLASIAWRRNAGFGRFFLELFNVFPGEAVPSEELMRVLREFTPGQGEWGYFYLQP